MASKKSIVKVYLMDNTYASIPCYASTTVEELWEACAKKFGLSAEAAISFFIWAVSKDLEILLYADSTLSKCQEEWVDWCEMYCPPGSGGANEPTSPRSMGTMSFGKHFTLKSFGSDALSDHSSFKYVFRPASVVPMSVELGMGTDKEALRLLYLQAHYNVTHSLYPCSESEALALAGMSMQIGLGDYDDRIHRPGFLGAHELPKYLPKFYLRAHRPDVWEAMLFGAHKSHQGKRQVQVHQDYLALCRGWEYYGCTFFAARAQGRSTYYAQDYQGIVSLGVNEHGFHIIDPAINKAVSFGYDRVLAWDAIQSTTSKHKVHAPNMLSVTVAGEKSRVTFVFSTSQAELVYDLLFDWVDELDAADSGDAGPATSGGSKISITVEERGGGGSAVQRKKSRSNSKSAGKKAKRRSAQPIK